MPDSFFTFHLILGLVLAILTLTVVLISRHAKKKKKKSNTSGIDFNSIINALGGKNNIESINIEGERLAISVKLLSRCNLEELKEILKVGVFVTNNVIKFRVKEKTKVIYEILKNHI